MNPADLPFDSNAMLDGLRPWVECESPTFDPAAVNRMMDLATRDLIVAGARTERVAGRMGFGDCVRATFPHTRGGEHSILAMGHLDTVHPIGTLAKLPFRREGNRAWGPGILDMKGGNYLTLEAIRQLARAGVRTPLPITV
ncbi:MAG: M20/M25/M40 family metallo-hydrolase, partial [Rhodospirillales bacterium]